MVVLKLFHRFNIFVIIWFNNSHEMSASARRCQQWLFQVMNFLLISCRRVDKTVRSVCKLPLNGLFKRRWTCEDFLYLQYVRAFIIALFCIV